MFNPDDSMELHRAEEFVRHSLNVYTRYGEYHVFLKIDTKLRPPYHMVEDFRTPGEAEAYMQGIKVTLDSLGLDPAEHLEFMTPKKYFAAKIIKNVPV